MCWDSVVEFLGNMFVLTTPKPPVGVVSVTLVRDVSSLVRIWCSSLITLSAIVGSGVKKDLNKRRVGAELVSATSAAAGRIRVAACAVARVDPMVASIGVCVLLTDRRLVGARVVVRE